MWYFYYKAHFGQPWPIPGTQCWNSVQKYISLKWTYPTLKKLVNVVVACYFSPPSPDQHWLLFKWFCSHEVNIAPVHSCHAGIVLGVEGFEGYVYCRKVFVEFVEFVECTKAVTKDAAVPTVIEFWFKTFVQKWCRDSHSRSPYPTQEIWLKKAGRREKQKFLPNSRTIIFYFTEELSIQNGAILKQDQIVVPLNPRQCMIDKVRASHVGV